MHDPPPASSPATKSPRRFFRFGLRTLLIVAPLIAIIAAYGARSWYAARMQVWAVQQIEAAGGLVFREEDGKVVTVQMPGLSTDDAKLRELTPALHVFPALKSLILAGNQLTDETLEPLAELPALQTLYLADTLVTEEAMQRMKQRSPNLKIDVVTRTPKATRMVSRPIFKHALLALATTFDGRLVTGSADGKLRRFDLRRSIAEETIPAHTDWLFTVARHPRQPLTATGGGDNLIKLWNARGDEVGRFVGHDDDVHAVAFTPDGGTLVSSADDKTVRVWEVNARRERFKLVGHDGTIPHVAVSPDGATAASASRDDTIRLWNIATGEHVGSLAGHTHDVMFVDFAPHGKELASVSYDGTLRLWNLAEQREVAVSAKHGDRVFGVRWSPDGTRLLTAAGDGVRCFRRAGLRQEWHVEPQVTISAVHWLNDRRLATASVDGLVTIRDGNGGVLSRLTALVDR